MQEVTIGKTSCESSKASIIIVCQLFYDRGTHAWQHM